MTRLPHAAIFQALHSRLTTPASAPWGDRAYPVSAPAHKVRPYALYWQIGGGYRSSQTGRRQAEMVVGLKVVGNTLAAAFDGAAALFTRLDGQGELEADTPLNGGDDWAILTSTVEGSPITLREMVDGAPVFHEGFRLRLFMEERA